MEKWLSFVAVIASFSTMIGFVAVFVKFGREKGESIAYSKEMRKDIDQNQKDINDLRTNVNEMQIKNTELITTLSSDLGWIKSSLSDIKNSISNKKKDN